MQLFWNVFFQIQVRLHTAGLYILQIQIYVGPKSAQQLNLSNPGFSNLDPFSWKWHVSSCIWVIDLSYQGFSFLLFHGLSLFNCPEMSQRSYRAASAWAPVLTCTLPLWVFALETSWSHGDTTGIRSSQESVLYIFRWTGMHRQF